MEIVDIGLYKCRIYEWEGKITAIGSDKCKFNDDRITEWWGLKEPIEQCDHREAVIELSKGPAMMRIPPSSNFLSVHMWWGFDCIRHPFTFIRRTECRVENECCTNVLRYYWPSCRRVVVLPPGDYEVVYNTRRVYTSYPDGTKIISKLWIEEVNMDYVSVYNNLNCREVLSMHNIGEDFSKNVIAPEDKND